MHFLKDRGIWNSDKAYDTYDKNFKKWLCDAYKTWRNEHKVEVKGTRLLDPQLLEYFTSEEFGDKLAGSWRERRLGNRRVLEASVRNGSLDRVQQLIKAGTDVNKCNLESCTRVEIAEVLIGAGADARNVGHGLIHASKYDDVQFVKMYLRHGENVTFEALERSNNFDTLQTLLGTYELGQDEAWKLMTMKAKMNGRLERWGRGGGRVVGRREVADRAEVGRADSGFGSPKPRSGWVPGSRESSGFVLAVI